MRNKFQYIGFILGGLLVASCTSSPTAEKSASPGAGVGSDTLALSKPSMQGLKAGLDRLFPFLLDPKSFYASENEKNISEQILSLETIAQGVSHAGSAQSSDLTVTFLSRGFQEDMKRSKEAFQMGHKEFARRSLIGMTAYCIECHTRTQNGPSFQNSQVESILKKAGGLERGEYLMATRQFDAAFAEFDQVIKSTAAGASSVFVIDRAVKMALIIAVRFQGNIGNAQMVVDDVLKSSQVPFYLKATAQIWKSGLDEWRRDSKNKAKDTLKVSQALVQKGYSKSQGRDDRAGDIEMMRAQALLHPLLAQEKDKLKLGEILFLLGQTYEVVRDFAMWSLHEDYYEACVRKAPHSAWSMKCYKNLESSVVMGYTGSSGTAIPADVQEKLKELKILAL